MLENLIVTVLYLDFEEIIQRFNVKRNLEYTAHKIASHQDKLMG